MHTLYLACFLTESICLSLNMFFLPFFGILTWKSINITRWIHQAQLITLFITLKTQHLPYMPSFGVQNLNRTFFLTSKPLTMLGCPLFVVCLLLNTLFLLFFAVYLVTASAARIILHINLEKYHSHFACTFLTTGDFFFLLIFRFLNSKYIHCTFLVCCQSPKTQVLPFPKHFNI